VIDLSTPSKLFLSRLESFVLKIFLVFLVRISFLLIIKEANLFVQKKIKKLNKFAKEKFLFISIFLIAFSLNGQNSNQTKTILTETPIRILQSFQDS